MNKVSANIGFNPGRRQKHGQHGRQRAGSPGERPLHQPAERGADPHGGEPGGVEPGELAAPPAGDRAGAARALG